MCLKEEAFPMPQFVSVTTIICRAVYSFQSHCEWESIGSSSFIDTSGTKANKYPFMSLILGSLRRLLFSTWSRCFSFFKPSVEKEILQFLVWCMESQYMIGTVFPSLQNLNYEGGVGNWQGLANGSNLTSNLTCN